MRVDIEPQPDYLLAVVSGLFDKAKLADMLKDIFAASSRHGLRKILVDIRALEGEITFIARYDAGQLVADLQREPVRLAMLGTSSQIWPDRFFENVAKNRGVETKVTLDKAEALEWLRRNAASKSTGREIK